MSLFRPAAARTVSGGATASRPVTAPFGRARGLRLKYGIDFVLAAVQLVILSPLLLMVTALVLVSSPGPVLFRQQRIGQNGRHFVILKFRSMRQPTKAVTFEPASGIAPGGVEGEDRRTLVGRMIRALSIDELPQLINVLRGEMSLVGPRPERPRFVERFSSELPGYADRHHVRPGITGWAQVHGFRGATSIQRRLEFDMEYIRTWSLWLDIKILLLTAGVMLGMKRSSEDKSAVAETEVVGRRQPTHPLIYRQPRPPRTYEAEGAAFQLTAQVHGSASSLDS